MNGRAASLKRIALATLVILVAAVACALLWTTYMVYDDEGYVLYSLHEFVRQGHLYDQVYSQYGPFFFVFYRALHALGLVFTNTTARELTLVCWMGAVVAAAAIVWRVTRGSFVATGATIVGVFAHLWPMISEPSHPGGFIALVSALAAWVGANPRWSPVVRAAVIGALAAMLTLTKINVGIFLFVSAGTWWTISLANYPTNRGLRAFIFTGLIAVPVLLMAAFLREEWVWMFALVTAVGGLATVVSIQPLPAEKMGWREFAAAAAAAALVAAVTVIATLLTGTTIAGLLDGVLLGPLRHPSLYSLKFDWREGTLPLTIVSLLLAGWAARTASQTRLPVVALGRLAVLAGYAASALGLLPFTSAAFVLSYGVATAWVFVLPLRDRDPAHAARGWLALLFVLQSLHAYPVAGSQVSWGTFLWVPLAALGTFDLAQSVDRAWARRAGAGAVSALVLCVFAAYARDGWSRLRGSDELRVPGAETLLLPESFTSAIRILVRNADLHGPMLFTMPGMTSFNLWTGIAPPTAANATHWFNLLSPAQQDAILQRLQATPDAVVIVQRSIYDLLEQQHLVTRTPLLRWLLANYAPAFRLETYEFWVRRNRRIAAVDTARMYVRRDDPRARLISIVADLPAGTRVGSIELRRLHGNGSSPVLTWTAANAHFAAGAITPTGAGKTAVAPAPLPLVASGLTRLDVQTSAYPRHLPLARAILYLRDPAGRRVGEARFIE